jgi:hypothetical protein
VIILVVEIFAHDLSLALAQDTMYRFGRACPTYWHEDGTGGQCVVRAEWLSVDGTVLAASDYDQRESISPLSGAFARRATLRISSRVTDKTLANC